VRERVRGRATGGAERLRRTVVVKTSAWPYADPARDARCRDLVAHRTSPTIVERLAG